MIGIIKQQLKLKYFQDLQHYHQKKLISKNKDQQIFFSNQILFNLF